MYAVLFRNVYSFVCVCMFDALISARKSCTLAFKCKRNKFNLIQFD